MKGSSKPRAEEKREGLPKSTNLVENSDTDARRIPEILTTRRAGTTAGNRSNKSGSLKSKLEQTKELDWLYGAEEGQRVLMDKEFENLLSSIACTRV